MTTVIEQIDAKQAELADLVLKGISNGDDEAKFKGLLGSIETLKATIGAQDALDAMREIVGNPVEERRRAKSFAEAVMTSAGFKSVEANGSGLVAVPNLARVVLGIKAPPEIVSTAVTGGGAELLTTQNLGVTVTPTFRPPSIIDLITKGTSNADLITWVENQFFNNADSVAEATGYNDGSGAKPMSYNSYVTRQATVDTIAHVKVLTRQSLRNRGQLMGYIENELLEGLAEKAEEKIFTHPDQGILNISGTQVQPFDTSVNRTLLRSRALVLARGGIPQAVMLNPEDAVEVYDQQDAGGWYYSGGPVDAPIARRWGMQIVESELVPVGTAVVGDFRSIKMDETLAPETETTNSHLDFFTRNLEAVRAEMAYILRNERPDRLVLASLA